MQIVKKSTKPWWSETVLKCKYDIKIVGINIIIYCKTIKIITINIITYCKRIKIITINILENNILNLILDLINNCLI